MPRKAAKGSPRYYFHQGTEDAIIRHNKETRPHMRERIYNEHIRVPFEKLAENIIHTFKFYYFDVPSTDVMHEVVSFLYMNMHKFTEGKGKAFSYFSIVAKNYLILHNNNNYKKMKQTDGEEATDYKRDPIAEACHEDTVFAKKEYMDMFVDYWINNLSTVFKRKQDNKKTNVCVCFESSVYVYNYMYIHAKYMYINICIYVYVYNHMYINAKYMYINICIYIGIYMT